MAASLTTITNISQLTELKELHLIDWPKHCVGFFWLDNYLRWLAKNPGMKYLTFYTLDANWRRDGLFLLVVCM